MKRVLGAVLGAVIVSCTSAPTLPERSNDAPVRGGRLVLAGGDPRTLQPIHANDVPSQGVIRLIYADLLRTDPDTGAARPGLAERYEASADGLTVTYWLRPGLVWSDGQVLDGNDYKYAVEAIARSKRTTLKSVFQDIIGWADYVAGRTDEIAGVRVSEAGRRIDVTQARTSCSALRALAGATPLPRHLFSAHWNSRTQDVATSIDDSPLGLAPPVASGPFVLAEWREGVQVRLVRNHRYYLGAPLIDEVVLKRYADGASQKAALITGEIMAASVSPHDIDEVKSVAPHLELLRAENSNYSFLAWNQRSQGAPWLADRRVRHALWHGLDVDSIVRNVLLGYGRPVLAHTPRRSWAYDGTDLKTYPYDPGRARALLESAGAVRGADGVYRWTDGRPMRMTLMTNSGNADRRAVVQIAQEQYRQIGVQIDVDLISFNALVDVINDRRPFDGIVLGWGLGPEPDAYSIWHSSQGAKGGNNFIQFGLADLDAAIDAGRRGPDCSVVARRAAFARMDRILNEEAPYVFLFATETLVFRDPRLVAPPLKPWGDTRIELDVQTWWIRR